MAWVFAAFTLAYALFEIPTGYLGDRMGARRVLIRVVLWWSFFTAATGWVWSFWSLARACGSCSARARPAASRTSPAPSTAGCRRDERVRAQGILWMCGALGRRVAPLLLALSCCST